MTTTITRQDIQRYNLTDTDVAKIEKYGRSPKAWVMNLCRTKARDQIWQQMSPTRDEWFLNYPKSVRLPLVNRLANEFYGLWVSGDRGTSMKKTNSQTERALRKASHQARVKNNGESIVRETNRTYVKIDVQDTEQLVKEYIAKNGEATHCSITGIEFSATNPMLMPSLDHIIPISKGGSHSASNIRFILRGLNLGANDSGDEFLMEFITAIQKITQQEK